MADDFGFISMAIKNNEILLHNYFTNFCVKFIVSVMFVGFDNQFFNLLFTRPSSSAICAAIFFVPYKNFILRLVFCLSNI